MDHPSKSKSKTESAAPVPDWLPDWTKPQQYPNPKTTSMEQWAWEFLRRNPKYQQACDLLGISPEGLERICPLSLLHEDTTKALGVDAERLRGMRGVAARYYLRYLIHPSVEFEQMEDKGPFRPLYLPPLRTHPAAPAYAWVTMPYDYKSEPEDQRSYPLEPITQSEVVVKFDLQFRTENQIRIVKKELNRIQQKLIREHCIKTEKQKRRLFLKLVNPREHTEMFPIYLRVLDAHARGVTLEKMADPDLKDDSGSFWRQKDKEDPDSDVYTRLKKSLAKAKRLRDGGYVPLLLPKD
jgi:hypothetical protein